MTNDPNRLDEYLKRLERPKYVDLHLTVDELEYVIFEIFEKAAFHSSPSTKLNIQMISKSWRMQAHDQGVSLDMIEIPY